MKKMSRTKFKTVGGEHWHLVYFLGTVGLIIVLLGAAWLKESPRSLVLQGRVKEAEEVVEEIVAPEYKVDLSKFVVPDKKNTKH